MGTHGITAGTAHRQRIDTEGSRDGQRKTNNRGRSEWERRREEGWGGRKTRSGERERGHDDRGRIMTIITIYMQVPSLPAHEQSTHSISYLI